MAERKLKFAVPAGVLDSDARVAAERAGRLGFEGLEFPAFGGALKLHELSATGRREFRHVMAGNRVDVAAVRVDLGGKGLGPGADVDRALVSVEKAMEAARGVGASVVTVELGPLPEPVREEQPKEKIDPGLLGAIILPTATEVRRVEGPRGGGGEARGEFDEAAASLVDSAMIELGRRADRYSVPVAFRSDLASYAAIERAIRAAGCPWFGVELDPVAVLRDAWEVSEVLSRLGAFVRHVRARDAMKGADRRTRAAAVGQGNVNWEELLALLDEAGYHGWVTVDPTELQDRVGAARAGAEALRRVSGGGK